MPKTLEEMQAANLPHATCENIGVSITPKDDSDGSLADEVVAEADAYFAEFTPGPDCPKCGATLVGWLGSFTWGIANGEGHCSKCHYPARALHRKSPFSYLSVILPYHPDSLSLQETP